MKPEVPSPSDKTPDVPPAPATETDFATDYTVETLTAIPAEEL